MRGPSKPSTVAQISGFFRLHSESTDMVLWLQLLCIDR